MRSGGFIVGIVIVGFFLAIMVIIGLADPKADPPTVDPPRSYPKDNPGPEAPDLWFM